MLRDPVCGMSIDPAKAAASADFKGKTFFFCSQHCLTAFKSEPGSYAEPESGGRLRPVVFGAIASVTLLAMYFAILGAISGWAFTAQQFSDFWYFIVPLAAGFGLQVGLFTRLRQVISASKGTGTMVAASGTTSTAAMVSCCAHYVVSAAPVLGASGLVAFAAQFQVELFWVGLLFNLAGIAYIGLKLFQASKVHAGMEAGAPLG